MSRPLAIHLFENLLLGTGVSSGLEKLGYEVVRLDDPALLALRAAEWKPFLVVLDLTIRSGDPCAAIRALKNDAALRHIRVLAYGDHRNESLLTAAREAGADVVTTNGMVCSHLAEVVQQTLP